MENNTSNSAKDMLNHNIKLLIDEREEWSGKVEPLYAMLNSKSSFIDLQVRMLSFRHVFVDKVSFYRNKYSSISNKLSEHKAKVFESLLAKYHDYHTNFADRDIMANGNPNISILNQYLEELKNQIDFFNNYIELMDKLGYAMKLKVDMEKNMII